MEDAHGNIPGGYFTVFVSASAPVTRKKKSLTYENNYNFKTSDKGSSGKVYVTFEWFSAFRILSVQIEVQKFGWES
jgi:hypothetical protein